MDPFHVSIRVGIKKGGEKERLRVNTALRRLPALPANSDTDAKVRRP